jgi:hypothetical protein
LKFSKFLIGCIMISFIFLMFPNKGYACSCANTSVEDAFDNVDAVFTGKVTAIKKNEKETIENNTSIVNVVTIEVTKSWKGVTEKEVTVKTSYSTASCGVHFEMDKEYLIYAYGDNKWSTNICTKTRLLSQAKDDVNILNTLQPQDLLNDKERNEDENDLVEYPVWKYVVGAIIFIALSVLIFLVRKRKS